MFYLYTKGQIEKNWYKKEHNEDFLLYYFCTQIKQINDEKERFDTAGRFIGQQLWTEKRTKGQGTDESEDGGGNIG